MTYHIVLNRPTDLVALANGAAEGANPRHTMAVLAEALQAIVHDGSDAVVRTTDRLLAKVTRTQPLWWAIARTLRGKVRAGDVIYCTGEDVGYPVAASCGGLPNVHVALMAHHTDSLKKRVAMRLFNTRRNVSLFFAVGRLQTAFLSEYMKPHADRVRFIWDQTDTDFFSPGPTSTGKERPIVMSVGLERRDYRTLAEATADLDIDVRISGYSPDTRAVSQAFPSQMPANMSRRFYSWPDLQQLYRDADIVVVSLFPNRYAAGVQVLMQAMACGRPLIITATEGLSGYAEPASAMRILPPGDPPLLRQTIVELLGDSEERERLGREAVALAGERFPCDKYVGTLATALRQLAAAD